jgi:hypothetical protein
MTVKRIFYYFLFLILWRQVIAVLICNSEKETCVLTLKQYKQMQIFITSQSIPEIERQKKMLFVKYLFKAPSFGCNKQF